MNKVEVCLTPELIHQHSLEGKIVVVVDIFRATSCMVAGLATGVKSITPVAELEACSALMAQGYIGAAERGGQKVEGFDIGNSPYSYMESHMQDKKVAVTTTNGTLAIQKSLHADEIIIGAFLNLKATTRYLLKKNKDVVIHCAGWKGTANLEDTAYAGALINALADSYEISNDSGTMARLLYDSIADTLYESLLDSAHAKRLAAFGINKDLKFCTTIDEFDAQPVLVNKELILA